MNITIDTLAVLERARAVLTDDDRWTAYLAAYNAQRVVESIAPGGGIVQTFIGPPLSQPVDGSIEVAPIEADDVMPPQRFPAVRLFLLGSTSEQGINAGIAETVHSLEARCLIRVSARGGTLAGHAGLSYTLTEGVLQAEALATAVRYLLEAGMVNAAAGIFNVLSTGSTGKGLVSVGDTTLYRIIHTFDVWQKTRSGRFEHPVTD